MPNYYDPWKEEAHTCKKCGWSGIGADLTQGELFRDCFEMDCPECGEYVTVIMLPTLEESRANWDKLSEVDKRMVESAQAHQNKYNLLKLVNPDDLPDIESDQVIIVWDMPDDDTVLLHDGKEIWREPGVYEGHDRYKEVVKILLQKYGVECIQDVVPTRRSMNYLFGDSAGSVDMIFGIRRKLNLGQYVNIDLDKESF